MILVYSGKVTCTLYDLASKKCRLGRLSEKEPVQSVLWICGVANCHCGKDVKAMAVPIYSPFNNQYTH